jgi:hypothetical protein
MPFFQERRLHPDARQLDQLFSIVGSVGHFRHPETFTRISVVLLRFGNHLTTQPYQFDAHSLQQIALRAVVARHFIEKNSGAPRYAPSRRLPRVPAECVRGPHCPEPGSPKNAQHFLGCPSREPGHEQISVAARRARPWDCGHRPGCPARGGCPVKCARRSPPRWPAARRDRACTHKA